MANRENLKVSVLMLAYNQERYLDEAIRSVMLQRTDFPFEVIIGNDASTDQTGAICGTWQDNYPHQIKLFNREQNLGLIQNFLQTYVHCEGDYVAICEGDDFWTDKHKLQRQVDFLEEHPDYSTCFHRVINYFEDRGTKSLSNGGQKVDTDILDLARCNYISNVSAVFRRGLFGELPEWFAHVSTYDYAIHLLNAEYGKIHYMKRPMAVYRQHGRAIWSEAGTDKKLKMALDVRMLLLDHFRSKGREDVFGILKESYLQICLNLIRYYRLLPSGAEEEIKQVEGRLLKYFPEWTTEEIRSREKALKPAVARRFIKLLKGARALVSLFIPLPRIRG